MRELLPKRRSGAQQLSATVPVRDRLLAESSESRRRARKGQRSGALDDDRSETDENRPNSADSGPAALPAVDGSKRMEVDSAKGVQGKEISRLREDSDPLAASEARCRVSRRTAWGVELREAELAPQGGLEPPTLRLTAGCSAIELLRNTASAEALCGTPDFSETPSPAQQLVSVPARRGRRSGPPRARSPRSGGRVR
jgi:hypothetical protein